MRRFLKIVCKFDISQKIILVILALVIRFNLIIFSDMFEWNDKK